MDNKFTKTVTFTADSKIKKFTTTLAFKVYDSKVVDRKLHETWHNVWYILGHYLYKDDGKFCGVLIAYLAWFSESEDTVNKWSIWMYFYNQMMTVASATRVLGILLAARL